MVSLHRYGVVLMAGGKKSQFQTFALKQTASKKWWPYIVLLNEESTMGLVWVLWGSIKTQRMTSVYCLTPHELETCKNQGEHSRPFRKSLSTTGDTRHPGEPSQLLVYYHRLSRTYAHLKPMTYTTPKIIIQRLFFLNVGHSKASVLPSGRPAY